MNEDKKMVEKRDWAEFQSAGLVWYVNRLLHLFGWAIVLQFDENDRITDAYPARCRFRGFDGKCEDNGFRKLTKHLSERWPEIEGDVDEEEDSP